QLFSNDEHSLIHNRQGHSTGLGMQNVKKRIELFSQQAGSMTVHSSKVFGTTVRLNLPYIKQKGDGQFA
ncbi:hypothetical protein R0J91_18870, partial [Micrococcus sp. SIMBA_131]